MKQVGNKPNNVKSNVVTGETKHNITSVGGVPSLKCDSSIYIYINYRKNTLHLNLTNVPAVFFIVYHVKKIISQKQY